MTTPHTWPTSTNGVPNTVPNRALSATNLNNLSTCIAELAVVVSPGVLSVTASTVLAADSEGVVFADATSGASGAITVTLPDATACEGKVVTVRKIDATLNRVGIAPNGTQTIGGLTARALRLPNESITVVSDGANWRATPRTERIVGGWNLDAGLLRWRQSWGQAGKLESGVGLGGIDVLIYGDSIAEGGRSTSGLFGCWAHRLKLRLQARFNPPGVTGGYGFVPALAGTTAAAWPGTADGVNYGVEDVSGYAAYTRHVTKTTLIIGNAAYGPKGIIQLVGGGDQVQFAFDGTDTDAERKRLGVTRIECLGSDIAPNQYGPRWDVFPGAAGYVAAAVGTGGQTGSYADGASTQHGTRWGVGGHLVALDPTQRNVLQITGPAAGNYVATDLIAYNGDYDCGVRVHNLGHWGWRASNMAAATGMLETMDTFGADTGNDANGIARAGACRAKLVIFDFIANEAATGTAIATFKTNYATVIDRALALTTKPSVLLVIPPMRSDVVEATYRTYANAVYELAEGRDNVAVLDLWGFVGNGAPNTAVTGRCAELSWRDDGVHFTDTGQQAFADVIYEAIT